ncbi:NADH-quinone oxidoreductase subunit E [Roseicitreum antarcticum]|uniref:NADH dehydrogenase subunit E n=1 Tax=Roseicitreum antarcticum TaxID=564137 RepID=A0A1H2ZSR9_9RHOB|nr:NADH-quinone oxidoreductase subunit E [Roseicitreum antarcticum]SDX19964.1 NADH dehydrogenase subunit E [Roseicitreum antarcticum]
MLRRLHHTQPETFAFTPDNAAWAEGQISKYPEGRQASAIIPLLWRAQEQEGWLSRPAIEGVADMLGMPYIRALEVATFYFMFQLQPVGSVANIQICGTLSCMLCGSEDLISVCKKKIAPKPHQLSADGKFSWEEVECLGACANAPMAQIGKDYYEDMTAEGFEKLLDDMAAGKVPTPGSQSGRFASEPAGGRTTLTEFEGEAYNGSVGLAVALGDTLKRIDGTEVPLTTPWRGEVPADAPVRSKPKSEPKPSANKPIDKTGVTKQSSTATKAGVPEASAKDTVQAGPTDQTRPETLSAPRDGGADDLKQIKGVGPKLEELLHSLGFYHFDQIANWSDAEIAWVDDNMEGFRGRVTRDDWVAQAKALAAGDA